MLVGVLKASRSSVDEQTESGLCDLPAIFSMATTSIALSITVSSISWNVLPGSGASDICSNDEASRSHWLCTCGPNLLLPWHRPHRKLSLVIFCHISANPSTWPSFSKRVDRVTSSNLMVIFKPKTREAEEFREPDHTIISHDYALDERVGRLIILWSVTKTHARKTGWGRLMRASAMD